MNLQKSRHKTAEKFHDTYKKQIVGNILLKIK